MLNAAISTPAKPRRSYSRRRQLRPLSPLAAGTPYAVAFWRALAEIPAASHIRVDPRTGTIAAKLPNGGRVAYRGKGRIADRLALETLP